MNKHYLSAIALSVCVATASSANAADDTHAERAASNAAQASGHASASAGHSIAASGQVTSAASAAPLSIGGSALVSGGAVSMGAAHGSAHAATSKPNGAPLEITDEAITVMPPNEALKKPKETKPENKPGNNI
ncbi:MAG TPA: hypothetical protein VFK88_05010 [Gallionella sp.]|nr:hypothetical protein [Gallionella sp.]